MARRSIPVLIFMVLSACSSSLTSVAPTSSTTAQTSAASVAASESAEPSETDQPMAPLGSLEEINAALATAGALVETEHVSVEIVPSAVDPHAVDAVEVRVDSISAIDDDPNVLAALQAVFAAFEILAPGSEALALEQLDLARSAAMDLGFSEDVAGAHLFIRAIHGIGGSTDLFTARLSGLAEE